MEAAAPGKTLPSKQELLDFQSRWMRPAGISALLGALIVAVALPLQPSTAGDTDAERLTKFHDQSTQLILGQGVLIGVAILLFIPLLYVLIKSAQGRTLRVPRWMVSVAFVGPILFSVSGLMVAVGLSDVSDKFSTQAPAKERQAREQATAAQAQGAGKQTGTTTGSTSTPSTTSTAQTTTEGITSTSATTTTPPTTTTPRTPDQAASKARDDLASNLLDDSTLLQVGSLLRFVGLLSLVFALIYIPLWTVRTGLLTRFWAYLGLALGLSLLLVPVGIFGLVLWFAAVGLMLAGWWPTPLPAAWDAGEAIPWPRRGDDLGPPPEERGGETIEGSGRQVSEEPAPENGDAPPDHSDTQGQRRKKRKRRK